MVGKTPVLINIVQNLVLSNKIDTNLFFKEKSLISILNTCLFNNFSNKNIEINQEMFNLITNHPLFDKEICSTKFDVSSLCLNQVRVFKTFRV